jgi:hypothetical protein
MTADEVLDALSRYTKDSMDSDRQTATKLGIRPPTLEDWLSGRTPASEMQTRESGGLP